MVGLYFGPCFVTLVVFGRNQWGHTRGWVSWTMLPVTLWAAPHVQRRKLGWLWSLSVDPIHIYIYIRYEYMHLCMCVCVYDVYMFLHIYIMRYVVQIKTIYVKSRKTIYTRLNMHIHICICFFLLHMRICVHELVHDMYSTYSIQCVQYRYYPPGN